MPRPFAKQFYRSKGWEKVRSYVLMRDSFLCSNCGKPAEEVHHIVHLSPENILDPKVSLNPDNLICLCRDCHFEIHREDKKRGIQRKKEEKSDYEFDKNGYLVRKEPEPDPPYQY